MTSQDEPATVASGPVDRFFAISARGSTVGREVRGGLTTFMAMAYILLLNPVILSVADAHGHHLNHTQVATSTAFAAAVTTVVMGFVGRAPLAMAAGLSVSAVVANQVAPAMSWSQAMGMCVIYGGVIVVLVATGMRERIMNAIPMAMKHAITMGIGLFVCLLGLVQAGFVTGAPGAVGKGGIGIPGVKPLQLGVAEQLRGWPVLLFCITVLLIFVLQSRRVPGAILLGIVGGTVLAMIVQAVGKLPDSAWGLNVPELKGSIVSTPDFGLLGKVSFSGLGSIGAVSVAVIVFTLVLAGFFDAIGTIIGVGQEAGLADEQGRMPGLSRALIVDGAGGAFGGFAGASGQTIFVESVSGVGEGARTGLASVLTGLLFGLAMFLTPLAAVIPSQVAAAALVVIGSMMITAARHIRWSDRAEAVPVFLTTVLMPFTYSITAGMAAGVISFVVIRAAQGRWREPGWLMWVLSGVFLVYFALDPIESWLGAH
ncbi:MFS transporter [Mangrovactinospora gilvigrisea]|uniref:MFS transporter n=1 Tax=Mangrovactinospora gilvigrisea TaxID=1428644 RepID=A0A1J7BCV2_9ACTN|nr:NCS2 family permease [Mangrovactinospora gilvigrisea]OIV36478.1 MFS transporter [Mangrovactinospora gilvigrisea]